MNSSRIKQLIGAGLLGIAYSVSQASPIDDIVVVGDSLSDMGRLYADFNEQFPPDPPYWQGRSSNGRVWAEVLADDILGARLRNYAIAGATTNTRNVWDDDFPDNPNNPFGGLQNQVADYLSEGTDAAALHVVWAGSNDFLDLFNNPGDPVEVLQTAVTDLVTAVATLRATGAELLHVINVPDLGLTPRLLDAGLSAEATALVNLFNAKLVEGLGAAGLSDVPVFDSAAFLRAVVADPEAYGLINVTEACVAEVANPATWCYLDPRIDQDEYLFWDEIHPTRAFHALAAQAFAASLPAPVSAPGTVALLTIAMIVLVSPLRSGRVLSPPAC